MSIHSKQITAMEGPKDKKYHYVLFILTHATKTQINHPRTSTDLTSSKNTCNADLFLTYSLSIFITFTNIFFFFVFVFLISLTIPTWIFSPPIKCKLLSNHKNIYHTDMCSIKNKFLLKYSKKIFFFSHHRMTQQSLLPVVYQKVQNWRNYKKDTTNLFHLVIRHDSNASANDSLLIILPQPFLTERFRDCYINLNTAEK